MLYPNPIKYGKMVTPTMMMNAGAAAWVRRSVLGRPEISPNRAMPSFFVIGPPRTGTTWLHDILRHRAVLPTPNKETRFFDRHFSQGLEWYRAHFPPFHDNRPVGEIAPTYFASTEARERIAKTLPRAKVVCIFRNPFERVLSLYRLKRAYGMIPWSFEEALLRDPELLESSKYATHLKAWQQLFSPGQLLITFYDDLQAAPQRYVNSLADFIEIPRFVLPAAQITEICSAKSMTQPRNYSRTRTATLIAEWFKARRLDRVVVAVRNSALLKLFVGGGAAFAELSPTAFDTLYELVRGEVEELERLANRTLPSWKEPKSTEEMAAGRGSVSQPAVISA